MKNIVDPEFQYHIALGRLWGLMSIGLADNVILPMNAEDETLIHKKILLETKQSYWKLIERNNISLGNYFKISFL